MRASCSPYTDGPSSATVSHVRRPVSPYPPHAWAPKQRPISSPLCSHLRSTALAAFSLLCLSLYASVPCAEHHCWEPLLSPRAPPCRHRLGVRSPSRPPLRADRTLPDMPFSFDQATVPAAKHLHDVSPRWSSSGLISNFLSTMRMLDNFLTQHPAPNDRRSPPPRRFPPCDHTPSWKALLQ
jgi:hypothetical protein